jgi:hypothetical protein
VADEAEKHNFGKDIELGEAEVDVCPSLIDATYS